MKAKILISENQAVKLSGLGRTTFKDLVDEGYIPYIPHNNRRLFKPEWLNNISPNKKAKKQVSPTVIKINGKTPKFKNALEYHLYKEAERALSNAANN